MAFTIYGKCMISKQTMTLESVTVILDAKIVLGVDTQQVNMHGIYHRITKQKVASLVGVFIL